MKSQDTVASLSKEEVDDLIEFFGNSKPFLIF